MAVPIYTYNVGQRFVSLHLLGTNTGTLHKAALRPLNVAHKHTHKHTLKHKTYNFNTTQ